MASGINKIALLFNPHRLWAEVKRNKMINGLKPKVVYIGYYTTIFKSQIGNHTFIGSNVKLLNSTLGDHSYLNSNTLIQKTTIGKYTSIGSDVKCGLGKHPTDLVSTHPAFYSNNKEYLTYSDKNYFEEYQNIEIGNDVWIGINAVIMGGVKIGDGAIVAAGSIITKDVEPYSIVGGVPAKHIKFRIPENLIDKIKETRWWDKDEEWMAKNFMFFHKPTEFLKLFDNQ